MWKHHVKIFFRNFFKAKFYHLISILGLAVGLAFAFLTGNYLAQEASVNASIKNLENQYLVKSRWKNPDLGRDFTAFGPFGEALKENNPDKVANYYRFDAITSIMVVDDKEFREEVQLGDASVISMFGLPLLHGDPDHALAEPNSMVVPVETARKFFGKEDVIGETVLIENFNYEREAFIITGVLDEMPKNTVLNMFVDESSPILLPPKSVGRGNFDNWNNPYVVNYVELMPGVQPEELDDAIRHVLQTHLPEEVRSQVSLYLEPMRTSYFNANNGMVRKVIWVLTLISVFVLLMAVVNFVNLAVGNASARIKEIGIRKAMGVRKAQLFGQFMAESILLSSSSMLLALLFYELARTYFGEIFGVNPHPVWYWPDYFIGGAVALTAVVGFFGGIYPSLVLSGLPLVDSLKGRLKSVQENVLLRRSLIVFQMIVSLTVLGTAIVILKQVDYFFNTELGYSRDAMVSLVLPREWNEKGLRKMETFRESITSLPGIRNASLSYELPNGRAGFSNSLYREGGKSEDAVSLKVLQTDEHYAQTYQIDVLAGQYFHGEAAAFKADRIVLNESAARALGYTEPEEAIGEKVIFQGSESPVEIAGIVRDFHFESLHEAIRPLAFTHVKNTNTYRYLNIRTDSPQLQSSMGSVEAAFREMFRGAIFEYEMMDDTFRKLYHTEIRLKKSALAATVIALLIVIMGMLGVVSLALSRRVKELGIRQVLGASAIQITSLFLKEYLAIWLVATLVSLPLVAALMNNWLAGFAYRIELQWWMLAVTGLAVGTVTVLTVGIRSLKAALMNPVESLRTE
ncbi:ABC transporter permease [Negadavirga shengliensis]|uniref:FtsX-like permease family protein n=1 Tax=Negadavirga shengliensis TaxID=1389218 RepID=A0ABV9SWG9_9BACT